MQLNLSLYLCMYFSFSNSRSLLACCVAAAALSARAQTPPSSVTQLSPVVVEGRAADLIGEAATSSQGSVGYIELSQRPLLRRGELLEVIPGIAITQHSGGGKANQYFLRGFNLDHGTDFSISVDGMPVNMRSHAHGQGYADLNFIIPEFVQSVDYNKGPFFAEVGDFSGAGAASYRLFRELPRSFIRVEGGEHGFVRAVAGNTLNSTAGATTVGFEAEQYDGPWLLEDDFRRFNLLGRHVWSSNGSEFALTALGYHAEWNATDQIPLRAVASGEIDRFGYVDPSNGGTTDRASVSLDWTRDLGSSRTELTAYAIHYRLNLFSNFTYFLDDPVRGDQFNQRDRRVIAGAALDHTWTGGAWQGPTTVGVEVRGDFISELGLHRTEQRAWHSTVRDDELNQFSIGAHARTVLHLNDRLRADAGLRGDVYAFDVKSDVPRNSGERTAAIVSPKLSLVYSLAENTELYLNGGFGFHSNDARGTVIRIDPVSGDSADRVDPLVRSRGMEVGLRSTIRPGWISTLSLWQLDLDSELVFVGDAGGTEPSGASRRTGVEVSNFLRLGSWFTLDGDFAFTHARYRDAAPANHVANSLATVVTGGASVDLPSGWFGGVRFRYFGPQPLTEDDSERAPSSTTLNARIGFERNGWSVALAVLNLLDRENNDIAYHYASRLPGESADGIEDMHFHPAEPRMVRLTLTRSF